MRLNARYALLTFGMALFLVPATAQTKKTTAKKTTATTKKAAAKPAAAKAVTKPVTKPAATKTAAVPSKSSAKSLGDAAAKAAVQDTTKKGGTGANTQNGGSLSEEIVVTTNYKPVLADAVKIRRNPDLEDKTPYKAPLAYKTIDKRLEQNSDIRQMEAMKMPAQRDSDLYNNYVKGGLGSMKTTYGELYVNNGRDNALQTGVYLKHFAQSGSDFYKQNYSNDEIKVFGKSVGEVVSVRGRIGYDRLGTDFYGYNQYAVPTKLNVDAQHFNTISAEGELTKNFKDVDQDFTYAAKLNGYIFNNAFQGHESSVVLSGFINETVKQFYAGLNGSLDLSTQKDSLYSLSNNIIRLNPYLKFQGTNYKIDAGVNIVDEFGFNSRFSIFPAARLEFQVIPKYVRLFAEVKGDVNKTSMHDLSYQNPFLGQNIPIKNSVDQIDVAAGLKGTMAPGIGFKFSIYRNEVKNMPLLISDFNFASGYNRFNVIYDGGRARVTGFNGELDFKATEDVDIFGRVEIKDYQMATEAQPWNLPKLNITAGTTIHISNKVNINGTLVVRGDTKDRTLNPTTNTQSVVTISSFADLNGGIEYKINNRFSVFGQVNNLLNSHSQTWLYYPNYGFNIFGGVSYGF
ncbi:hypothetical protein C8P68_107190 [Mucilaginibacter yixingensis]|uniref:TonB dependent receptor n=1 Tax=Mucilaginibacter yixingensis TaxID=1295612 RepID=A0A2T5J6F2_9SPHI|nr:hypothetical protein [Mucilaginibacter yixingensis]PTQ94125.1 hypothetical protein C8P68_107190 [Mucilaginibacter yixingensis]